ncbi:MAG TPA: hypothetical protein VN658_01090 [Candidatus Acidoferrales bacterium]|nr:hypothetical protein [Candidatus Acidoferrales bacterium]
MSLLNVSTSMHNLAAALSESPWPSACIPGYNALPVRDLATDLSTSLSTSNTASLPLVFSSDGAGHVFLSLNQLNLSTGVVTTLMTFDGNLSSRSASYQEGNTPGNPPFNLLGPIRKASAR